MDLAARVLAGDRRALARAITLAESGGDHTASLLSGVYPSTGRAQVVGVTGPPGAGKSSLVDRMVAHERSRGQTVGVVAVDPSSAFSGGAILGDRVRMVEHSCDPGVFIRSMATRGHLGGLARATGDVLDLMDAAGLGLVLVETVGVGQDEVEVIELAGTVLVVLVPGMGDDIQAIKAGILEIADIFVINKADRDGADRLEAELRQMMSLAGSERPQPAIVRTVATRGEGVAELAAAIEAHRREEEWVRRREERRRTRAAHRLEVLLAELLLRRSLEEAVRPGEWSSLIDAVAHRRIDPYQAVAKVLAGVRFGPEEGRG